MIEVRLASKLGFANYEWLNTKYHFSFAEYYDPNRMNFGQLRVWNDDTIEAQSGFPTHPHDNMEIITYVYQGAITHTDSLGNKGYTKAGDVQVMSAGSGITHSEYNLENQATRLFQIWIVPEKQNLPPSWGTKPFPKVNRDGKFEILASGFSEDEQSLRIQAKARLAAVTLTVGQNVTYPLSPLRKAYLVAAKGQYMLNGLTINAHDGVAVIEETQLTITAVEDCEIILVEVN